MKKTAERSGNSDINRSIDMTSVFKKALADEEVVPLRIVDDEGNLYDYSLAKHRNSRSSEKAL
jgi:hypothetical protein